MSSVPSFLRNLPQATRIACATVVALFVVNKVSLALFPLSGSWIELALIPGYFYRVYPFLTAGFFESNLLWVLLLLPRPIIIWSLFFISVFYHWIFIWSFVRVYNLAGADSLTSWFCSCSLAHSRFYSVESTLSRFGAVRNSFALSASLTLAVSSWPLCR